MSNEETGIEEIFTFPGHVNHDTMAEALRFMRNRTRGSWHRVRRFVVSAGFVDTSGRCHGRSESLDVDSRPEDTALLRAM